LDGTTETTRECAEKYLRELEELVAKCTGNDQESSWILALLRTEIDRTRAELARINRAEQ